MENKEFRKAIYDFVKSYRTGSARSDGGPGSGNFGHEGREGQVGGSAPSNGSNSSITSLLKDFQKDFLKSKYTSVIGGWGMVGEMREYLSDKGFDGKTIESVVNLVRNHGLGGEAQKEADSKIYEHIKDEDEIGKALLERVEFENGLYKEWKESHKGNNQLDNNNELIVYRKGDRGKNVESWTVNEEGADMGHGGIGTDHQSTLEQLEREGYRAIAGFGTMGGAPGEAEITFVKIPGSKRNDGGPGSGNFGHKGRPGEIGGSAPSDGSNTEFGVALLQPSKSSINKQLRDLASDVFGKDANYDDAENKAKKLLDSLEPGSVVTVPERWGDKKQNWVKDEWDDSWRLNGSGERWSTRWIASEFFQEDENDRAYVSKSAKTADERAKDLEKYKDKSWRNHRSPWANNSPLGENKPLTEEHETLIREYDAKFAGYGVKVEKNGDVYESAGNGEWYNNRTQKFSNWRSVFNGKMKGDWFDTNLGLNGVEEDQIRKVRDTFNSLPENMKNVYEMSFRNHSVDYNTNQDGAYFKRIGGTVYLEKNSDAETIFHEFTHALDYGAISKTIDGIEYRHASALLDELAYPYGKSAQEDFETMSKIVGFESDGKGWFKKYGDADSDFKIMEQFMDWARSAKYSENKDGEKTSIKGFDCVSDVISAMTTDLSKGSFFYGGHGSEYWRTPFNGNSPSTKSMEYFANFCTMKIFKMEDGIKLLRSISPNKFKAAETVFEEVFK